MRFTGLGAIPLADDRCRFRVWAPRAENVAVHLVSPQDRLLSLEEGGHGYFQGVFAGVPPGSLYFYRLDGGPDRPDPASRFQPQGVHGPSQVVDPHFPWEDHGWSGLPLRDYIIYELHVGTFTREGTLAAVIGHLDELRDLGITAVELMPVAQFPGNRNWGYDGAYPFAVQNSYGGPQGLKKLVNACHQKNLAVILDVVYNHLGPEGNYLRDFGFYFTDRYRTPWGEAVNYDGPYSDEVRRYFLENALSWIREYHLDALRLDALHAIVDHSAQPFLAELSEVVHQEAERLNRRVYLMAESDLNDVRLIRSLDLGGYGLDCHWNDDFHHAVHTLLTGEETGYYLDFGHLAHLAKAYKEGFIYSGDYSIYRKRRHGSSSRGLPAHRFVVFGQNHDQVGNRLLGERLSQLVSFEALKLAAGVVLLSPFIPLLFMGEEYGETAPFQYFVSHLDENLVEAVRRGRREEFAAFDWPGEPPDPQAEETFQRSKLNQARRREGRHGVLLEFHRELLRLRQEIRSLSLSQENREVSGYEEEKVLLVQHLDEGVEAILVFHFGETPGSLTLPFPQGKWYKSLDSAEGRWHGPESQVPAELKSPGKVSLTFAPHSVVLFMRKAA